jgi:hypothetical protein
MLVFSKYYYDHEIKRMRWPEHDRNGTQWFIFVFRQSSSLVSVLSQMNSVNTLTTYFFPALPYHPIM